MGVDEIYKKFVFPRPETINFPECKNKHHINIKTKSEINRLEAESHLSIGRSISLLKSGNILVGIDRINREELSISSSLEIYTIPELNLVQTYNFKERQSPLYYLSNTIQGKNGNIYAIYDKLYEFQDESINNGPKRNSNEFRDDFHLFIQSISFPDPENPRKKITKSAARYQCNWIMEANEGKLLFTFGKGSSIYLLDSINLEEESQTIYKGEGDLDLIFESKFNPNLLFICENHEAFNQKTAKLIAFDLKEFCNITKRKEPLFTIIVSKSQNVYGYCEYNQKYILLDTVLKGIYIIDMESKVKVAVCALKREKVPLNYQGYGMMYKLDDGQVVRNFEYSTVVDIRECKESEGESYSDPTGRKIFCGKYMASLFYSSYLKVVEFYE